MVHPGLDSKRCLRPPPPPTYNMLYMFRSCRSTARMISAPSSSLWLAVPASPSAASRPSHPLSPSSRRHSTLPRSVPTRIPAIHSTRGFGSVFNCLLDPYRIRNTDLHPDNKKLLKKFNKNSPCQLEDLYLKGLVFCIKLKYRYSTELKSLLTYFFIK